MRWGVTFEAFMGDLMMNWNRMMDRNLQKATDRSLRSFFLNNMEFDLTKTMFIPDAFAMGYPKYVAVALPL